MSSLCGGPCQLFLSSPSWKFLKMFNIIYFNLSQFMRSLYLPHTLVNFEPVYDLA